MHPFLFIFLHWFLRCFYLHSCHLLLDHVQFTLIHGPNIPGSYAILFSTATDFTFTTRHIRNWAAFLLWPSASFFLDLLVIALCSSPVEHWTSYNPRGSSSSVIYFAFSYCSWGSHDENTGVVCHSLLQWTFCQNFSLWPILGGLAHSFIELRQPLHHNKAMIHEGDPKRRHLGKWQTFLRVILALL